MKLQSKISLEPKLLLDIIENMSTAVVALNNDNTFTELYNKIGNNIDNYLGHDVSIDNDNVALPTAVKLFFLT